MTSNAQFQQRCRRTLGAWIAAALALSVTVASPMDALAEPLDPKAAARTKALEGTRIADEGQHERALTLFREAFALYPEPAYLYDIGVECQALGRDVEALDAYTRFLRDPRNTPHSLITHATELQAGLQKTLGEIQIRGAPEGADIEVDGEPRGTTPRDAPMRAKPGTHQIVVRRLGFQAFRTDIRVAEGAAVVVDVAPLVPTDAVERNAAPERQPWLSWDAALGIGFWTAGPRSNASPSPTFAVAAGRTLASLPAALELQLGAKIAFTYLNEPGATDTFLSLLVNPRLTRSLGDRWGAFADVGVGLLVLSGVKDQSFLLVPEGGRVTGALAAFELRPALGVAYALSETLSLRAAPAFVWNPRPNERFQHAAMSRFEVAVGVSGDL